MHDTDVKMPLMKAVTAWLITIAASMWQTFSAIPWDKLAQFAAFVYSCVLIIEWIRKYLAKKKERDICGTD